jgi:hypothetical protein
VGRHVAGMGQIRSSCSILLGKLEGKRPLGRPRRRWEDHINTHTRGGIQKFPDWSPGARTTNGTALLLGAVVLLFCESF